MKPIAAIAALKPDPAALRRQVGTQAKGNGSKTTKFQQVLQACLKAPA